MRKPRFFLGGKLCGVIEVIGYTQGTCWGGPLGKHLYLPCHVCTDQRPTSSISLPYCF